MLSRPGKRPHSPAAAMDSHAGANTRCPASTFPGRAARVGFDQGECSCVSWSRVQRPPVEDGPRAIARAKTEGGNCGWGKWRRVWAGLRRQAFQTDSTELTYRMGRIRWVREGLTSAVSRR